MKQKFEVNMDWRESQERLDHYNKWLMDPKREFTSVYPGFPGDRKSNRKSSKKPVAPKPETRYNESSVKEKQMSKLSIATDIVKNSASKQEAMTKIMETLGVTKSNAYVYFTKATKALGGDQAPKAEKPVKEKAVKVQKTETKKTNPITGTTPAKAKAKLAEIDAVIAGLKASGAQVASPFPV